MSIRDMIADAVNEDRRSGYGGYVNPRDIMKVEFRKGCAEIEVEFEVVNDDAYGYRDTVTIDAAPVLSKLLTWAMDEGESQ